MDTREQIAQEQDFSASGQSAPTPAHPMKWYHFLKATLWISAIYNIANLIVYFIQPNYYGGYYIAEEMKGLTRHSVFVGLVLTVYIYFVYRELHRQTRLAPKILTGLYILNIITNIVYAGLLIISLDDDMFKSLIVSPLVTAATSGVLLVINHRYFANRADVFQNGDGMVSSLFRRYKQPEPVQGEKVYSMRWYKLLKVILWLTVLSKAIRMAIALPTVEACLIYLALAGDFYDISEMFIISSITGFLALAIVVTAYLAWSGLSEYKASASKWLRWSYILAVVLFAAVPFVKDVWVYSRLDLDFSAVVESAVQDTFFFGKWSVWGFMAFSVPRIIPIVLYVGFIILNHIYLKKRAHLFKN